MPAEGNLRGGGGTPGGGGASGGGHEHHAQVGLTFPYQLMSHPAYHQEIYPLGLGLWPRYVFIRVMA